MTKLLLAAATLAVAATAQAALFTWDITPGAVGAGNGTIEDGAGTWNTALGNWTTDSGVNNVAYGNAATDAVLIGSGGAGAAITVGTVNANSLTFGTTTTSGYTLSGGTITLGGTTPSIVVNNTAFVTSISSVLAGSSALNVSGAGTLSLSGINTYTGGTVIDGARVNVNHASATGSSGSTSRSMTIKSGQLNLGFTGSTGAYGSGTSNYAVLMSSLTLGGTAGATSTLSSSGVISGNQVGFGVGPGTGGGITYSAANNGGTATISAFWAATGTSNAGNATVNVEDSSATNIELDFTGRISNTGQNDGRSVTLVKTGAGTMRISAQNFLPQLTVSAGKLIVNHAQALGANRTLNNLVTNNATIDLNGFNTTVGMIAGTSGVFLNDNAVASSKLTVGDAQNQTGSYSGVIANGAGTVSLEKAGTGTLTLNGANTYTGGTTVTAGTLTAGNASALGTGAVAVNGGSLNLGGYGVANSISVGASGKLIGATNQSLANVTFADGAALTGSFGAFDSGTLAAKVYNVTGGATFAGLSGQGTFNGGQVTVNGTHAPGNSPGTQTFSSGLAYGDNAVLNLEIAADGSIADSIFVQNGLTIGTGVTLNVALWGTEDYTTTFWDTDRTFTLISVTGAKTGSFLLSNTLGGGAEGSWLVAEDLNGVTATWTAATAVPEPSTYGLMGAGALAAIAFVRRRRKHA